MLLYTFNKQRLYTSIHRDRYPSIYGCIWTAADEMLSSDSSTLATELTRNKHMVSQKRDHFGPSIYVGIIIPSGRSCLIFFTLTEYDSTTCHHNTGYSVQLSNNAPFLPLSPTYYLCAMLSCAASCVLHLVPLCYFCVQLGLLVRRGDPSWARATFTRFCSDYFILLRP